ncbi:ComEC/Rec2 family competence protein [Kineococcus sp. SYSU DK005]|uniref:ComEC/Rec2 family competence protein n=1 Tax=Kineococcus sp. SYSU DK005 TaxID=3383126 RepID=UPI003D7DA18E
MSTAPDPSAAGPAGADGRPAPPLDLRLVAAALAGWAAAAWAPTAPRPATAALAATAGALLLTAVVVLRRRGGTALLVLTAVAAVLASTAVQQARATTGELPLRAQQRAVALVEAEVRSEPRALRSARPGAPARVAVDVRLSAVLVRGQHLEVAAPATAFADAASWRAAVGTRVRLTARLAPAEPGERAVVLLHARGAPRPAAPPGAAHRAAERLRAGLRAACAHLPADARGLLPGLVVGDTSALPADLEADMRAVGLSHLTAVSGANTTLVVGALVLAASRLGLGRRVRLLAAAAGLAGFVVLAHPEPSVLRAAVMGAVGLAGLLAGRPARGVPVLAGAVLVLLVADPWLAREAGFALSVLATAGLLLLARPWAQRLQRAGVPGALAHALAVPAAAQAACGPVAALLTPSVNPLSLPVNVLAAPAVAPATVLGLVTTLVAAVWPAAAAVVVLPAGLAVRWVALVAHRAADVPVALPLPAGAAGALVVAAGTVLLVAALALVLRGRRPGARRRRLPAAALALVLCAALLVRCAPRWGGPAGPWPAPDWLVVGCDVGQGDAVVLRSGPRAAVLVDAGPDAELVDGCLRRLDVRRLDAVVLTHPHADHVDGLAGAVRGREVARVLVSPLAVQPASRRVAEVAAGGGAEVGTASAGRSGTAGAVSWTVLAPAPGVAGTPDPDSSQVNDASAVLLAEVAGVRVLLTGDLEPDGQRRLLRGAARWPGGTAVDVVKVAHHGSGRQEPELYAALRPRVALVEVGAANDYGHPAPATLALLRGLGARVLRTDRDGDVAVAGTAADLRTLVRGPDPREAERRARYSDG